MTATLDRPLVRFEEMAPYDLPGPHTKTKIACLRAAESDPRLATMLELAARKGWPEAYSDDLYVHDCRTLGEHPRMDLIWILRDHGTHVVLLDPTYEHPRAAVRCAIPVIEYWSGEHFLNVIGGEERLPEFWYVFADGTCVESDANEAKAVVYETYGR